MTEGLCQTSGNISISAFHSIYYYDKIHTYIYHGCVAMLLLLLVGYLHRIMIKISYGDFFFSARVFSSFLVEFSWLQYFKMQNAKNKKLNRDWQMLIFVEMKTNVEHACSASGIQCGANNPHSSILFGVLSFFFLLLFSSFKYKVTGFAANSSARLHPISCCSSLIVDGYSHQVVYIWDIVIVKWILSVVCFGIFIVCNQAIQLDKTEYTTWICLSNLVI